MLNKSWKARRSAADGPSGCAHLVSPAPPAGTVLPSPEAGPWSIDRLDSRYPSPQTVELCSRARSSVPKVIYNGGAKHVFCNALSREPFSFPRNFRFVQVVSHGPRSAVTRTPTKSVEVSATNRIRSAAEICNWQPRFSDPGRMPNHKAPDILRQPVMRRPVCQTKGCAWSRKGAPEKLRCQKHRNFEAGFGVNTGASRRIARHTRAHWRAHESSDPSRASHRRIVVRKRPLNVRNSRAPFGKRSRISRNAEREFSRLGKRPAKYTGRGGTVIPARAR